MKQDIVAPGATPEPGTPFPITITQMRALPGFSQPVPNIFADWG
jgi:hypothetical protein